MPAGASRFTRCAAVVRLAAVTCGQRVAAGLVAEVTSARESFAPTRSARTPLVTGSSRYRLEFRYRAPPVRPKPDRRLEPSRHTGPSLLRAPSSWAPVRPACAGRLRRPTRFHGRGRRTERLAVTLRLRGPHSTARHGSANEPLAQPARRGLGPPHPLPREEHRDQPHPRCLPSMSCVRFGHPACAWHRPR